MYLRKDLSYELGSLEPFIDEETMSEHYNVHYKKYTDSMNEVIEQSNIPVDGTIDSLINVLPNYSKYPVAFRNNAGGYINHLLYFDAISPFENTYDKASEDLKNLINSKFGGYEYFKEVFTKTGKNLFGSGWVWLALNKNRLVLLTTANQDNPLMEMNVKILLGMDVWEHAYYLKHKANREAYINDFFNVIDWNIVSSRL